MKELVKVFKALGDKNRLQIIKMLEHKELCVCEISFLLKLANSTVSKHLSILRDAGLIEDKKDGKWVNYKLNYNSDFLVISEVLELIKKQNPAKKLNNLDIEELNSIDRNTICSK
ncbi:MAG: metalloregulator ArsR/SmtB family transcription factor [bacterium]